MASGSSLVAMAISKDRKKKLSGIFFNLEIRGCNCSGCYHVFLSDHCYQTLFHHKLDFLVKSRRHCASHVNPWPLQKAIIGWIDVHHYKLKVKSTRPYLDWELDISEHFSFGSIKVLGLSFGFSSGQRSQWETLLV